MNMSQSCFNRDTNNIMCLVSEPKLQNLVLFFQLPKKLLSQLKQLEKVAKRKKSGGGRNFFIFKPSYSLQQQRGILTTPPSRKKGGISFTVFPIKGSVIVTGLRSASFVPKTLDLFHEEYQRAINDNWSGGEENDINIVSPASTWNRRIVNSTYNGRIDCQDIDITSYDILTKKKLEAEAQDKNLTISFRTQFFPGILLKWKNLQGSCNVFNNGQYILVGTKTELEKELLYKELCALIMSYWTTMTPETSCVWSVAKFWTESSEEVGEEEDFDQEENRTIPMCFREQCHKWKK